MAPSLGWPACQGMAVKLRAALLIGHGAHAKEIQERLGHSTIRLTFDRYGHLLPSLDERLRSGLEEAYQQSRVHCSCTAGPHGEVSQEADGAGNLA